VVREAIKVAAKIHRIFSVGRTVTLKLNGVEEGGAASDRPGDRRGHRGVVDAVGVPGGERSVGGRLSPSAMRQSVEGSQTSYMGGRRRVRWVILGILMLIRGARAGSVLDAWAFPLVRALPWSSASTYSG